MEALAHPAFHKQGSTDTPPAQAAETHTLVLEDAESSGQ